VTVFECVDILFSSINAPPYDGLATNGYGSGDGYASWRGDGLGGGCVIAYVLLEGDGYGDGCDLEANYGNLTGDGSGSGCEGVTFWYEDKATGD
jgi:hypothetical protein